MRVISKEKLTQFWKEHPKSKNPLSNWTARIESLDRSWRGLQDVQQDFSTVDKVGTCYVFNIGGNNFRLIAKIASDNVLVKSVMTHKEYDKDRWKKKCDCVKGGK